MPSPLIYPKFQAINPTLIGAAAAGYKLKTFAAGTATPLVTYTDSTLAVANPTTIIMDAFGEASIWLGSDSYKFVFTDAADVVLWTVDNVTQASLNTGSGTIGPDWYQLPGPVSFVSATVFTVAPGTNLAIAPYNMVIGSRTRTQNSGGVIYSTVTALLANQVTVVNDSGVLDAGLSAAWTGIIPSAFTSASLPRASNFGFIGSAAATVNLLVGARVLNAAGTIVADTLNEGTTAGQWQAKVAGSYRIWGQVVIAEQAATNTINGVLQTVSVFKNGASANAAQFNWLPPNLTASTQHFPFNCTLFLAAGDVITIAITANFAATAPTAFLHALNIERVQ